MIENKQIYKGWELHSNGGGWWAEKDGCETIRREHVKDLTDAIDFVESNRAIKKAIEESC